MYVCTLCVCVCVDVCVCVLCVWLCVCVCVGVSQNDLFTKESKEDNCNLCKCSSELQSKNYL